MSLSLTYTQYLVETADYLGWGRNTEGAGSAWSAETVIKLQAILRSALNQVYYPETGYQWSWMKPVNTISLDEPYSEGTIEIVSGVVTLTGGTWPANAADGELTTTFGTYEIDVRDSDTQITLVDTSVDLDAGSTYTWSRYLYDLPSNFYGIDGTHLTFRPNSSELYPSINLIDDVLLRKKRQQRNFTSHPRYASIRPVESDGTAVQTYKMAFYPSPDSSYDLDYAYRVKPAMLDDTNDTPLGGPQISELILESCLATAEQKRNDSIDVHTQLFQRKLSAAIEDDSRRTAPNTIGYNSDRSNNWREENRIRDYSLYSYDGKFYYDTNNDL